MQTVIIVVEHPQHGQAVFAVGGYADDHLSYTQASWDAARHIRGTLHADSPRADIRAAMAATRWLDQSISLPDRTAGHGHTFGHWAVWVLAQEHCATIGCTADVTHLLVYTDQQNLTAREGVCEPCGRGYAARPALAATLHALPDL